MTAHGRTWRGGKHGTKIGWISGLLVSSLLAISCEGSTTADAPLPGSPTVVEVNLSEYRITLESKVEVGRVVFRVTNSGREEHQLTLLPLPDDLPRFDEQLRGSNRRILSPFAEIPTLQPGASTAFAVDLRPDQRYGLACFIVAPDGESFALKGMNLEFRTPSVTGSSD